eukprot:COSAG05_NODE_3838_length_1811_cov_3.217290_2_plen_303_part_01
MNLTVSIWAYSCVCVPGFANGVCEYNSIFEYARECDVRESDDTAQCFVVSGNLQPCGSDCIPATAPCSELNGTCSIDVDECSSGPCRNNATCSDSLDATDISFHTYRCQCIPGFANGMCSYQFISQYSAECSIMESDISVALGGNCDIDVDECASNPCTNGATCTDSTDNLNISFHTYRCICVQGFANGVCEYDFISEYSTQCSIFETEHTSESMISLQQFIAAVESEQGTELTGNCDIDVNECASAPCQNGATCTESTVESPVSFHAYQCTCVAGFANGVCEYDFISEYATECAVMESEQTA